ncbi:MAG: transcription elongation factor GreA [Pseudomonadota bacterium]|jgi:transcription elongation factor GreA
MKKPPLTAKGAAHIRDELKRLKEVERPRIVQAIAEARALGDLKENAEYHAAREQQSFNEGRISELEGILATAEIIDISTLNAHGKVVFGATVRLVEIANDDDIEVEYQIVGDVEADIKQNKVSISSPIARALIGKREGDEVQVQAPSGVKEYEILEVKYG